MQELCPHINSNIPWLTLFMHRPTSQQVERMRQDFDHREQRLRRRGWAARQIEDERAPVHPANAAAEYSK